MMFHVTSQIGQIHSSEQNIVKRKQRRPLENVWPVQNRVMLKFQICMRPSAQRFGQNNRLRKQKLHFRLLKTLLLPSTDRGRGPVSSIFLKNNELVGQEVYVKPLSQHYSI